MRLDLSGPNHLIATGHRWDTQTVPTAAAAIAVAVAPDPSLVAPGGLAPDIGMVFTVHGNETVFRTTGWLRRAPVEPPPPTGDPRLDAFLHRRFRAEYPEPETEYRLIHSLRGQATDIMGVSARGESVTRPIETISTTGAYMGSCPEEKIEEDLHRAHSQVGLLVGTYSTLVWKTRTLTDAMEMLPDLVEAFENHDQGNFLYIPEVNGHAVKGTLFVTDWDRQHGRLGPDYIWVQIAKRN